MRLVRSWLPALAVVLASPSYAQTGPDQATLDATAARLEKARDEAILALREVNAALAELNEIRKARAASPASATADKEPADKCAQNGGLRARVDATLPDGIAKQKKETSYDASEGKVGGLNDFVYDCLGLTKATDYENITNLSAQFTGTKGDDQIEAKVTRTARAIQPDGTGRFSSRYNRYTLGGFGSVGSDGSANLIDLTTSNFASGLGVLGGFEWARGSRKSVDSARGTLRSAIAKARQSCIAAHSVEDPLTAANGAGTLRLAADPVANCTDDKLFAWVRDNELSNAFWSDHIAPIWGYKDTPELLAGIEGRYAFQKISYRSVIDPATGSIITPLLPAEQEIKRRPFSLKLYAARNWALKTATQKENLAVVGLTGSMTYRREVDFIKGTSGVTFCEPPVAGADFTLCEDDANFAAPYSTRGFVGGLQLNLKLRRFWYLPEIAIAPRFTYAFDTKREGIEFPVYLLTDADGTLSSGFKYTCRFRGETPEGFELKKRCNVNIFVGTSFNINGMP